VETAASVVAEAGEPTYSPGVFQRAS